MHDLGWHLVIQWVKELGFALKTGRLPTTWMVDA